MARRNIRDIRREYLEKKVYQKQFEEAQKRYEKAYQDAVRRATEAGKKLPEFEPLNREIFENRIETNISINKISRKQAIKLIFETSSYSTQADNYRRAIQKMMSVGDYQRLRSLLYSTYAVNISSKTKVKNWSDVKIDLNSWVYDNTLKALIDPENKVYIKIIDGHDSTDPSYLDYGII